MSDDRATVFVGRRAGVIVARWSQPPVMLAVPKGERAQDGDLDIEALDADHPDVVAFDTRPLTVPAQGVERRLRALEDRLAALEAARGP